MAEPEGLGARVEWKRERAGMERRDLAAKAGISVHTVESLEQGRRIPTVPLLQRIARALDTTVAWMLSKPSELPSADPAAEGVIAIRRVLQVVDDDLDDELDPVEPLTLDKAQQTADYLWGCYWAGRYEQLARLLPTAIPQVRATARAVPSHQTATAKEALARGIDRAAITKAMSDAGWTLEQARAALDAYADVSFPIPVPKPRPRPRRNTCRGSCRRDCAPDVRATPAARGPRGRD